VLKASAHRFLMPAVCLVAISAVTIGIAARFREVRHFAGNAASSSTANTPVASLSAEQQGHIRTSLDALPLAFVANQGQTDPQVKYIARGNGYSVFLTANDAVFAVSSVQHSGVRSLRKPGATRLQADEKIRTGAIDIHMVGGNAKPDVVADGELPGIVNYYAGSDRKNWHTGVKQYASIEYRDMYPGVDMVFHGARRQLEFDFRVRPGADANAIELGFEGARNPLTDGSGNLILASSAGDVVLHKPVAYQEKDGKREIVEAAFLVKGNEVGLQLGSYDRARELVIDPTLTYATYLGGSGEDEIFGIAVDGSGNMYVTGQMASPNFPAHIGTVSNTGTLDAFVTRVNAAGTGIDFTTVISGDGIDAAFGIAVSGSAVYVVGTTTSATFPSTKTLGPGGGHDVFVASLSSTTGGANYVTRIGGTGTESGNAIAVDGSGNAYIGGETDSDDFPTASPIQGTFGGGDDGFVAKLNAAGTALTFSTYLGGTNGDLVTGLALDGSNNVYVGGITASSDFPVTTGAFQTTGKGGGDSFVMQIKADGSAGLYSTYFGGSSQDSILGIAVDAAGEAYITGLTDSTDLPTANAAQSTLKGANDIFVSKLSADGTGLIFSTYYGGTLDDEATGIALDAFGDAYVTGRTLSSDYPTGGSPFQATQNGASADAFVTEFSNTGFVVYSSYLGGTGVENSLSGNSTQAAIGAVAVDSSSHAYLAGGTASTTGFPVTSALSCCGAYAGGLSDGFIAKVGAALADFSVAVAPGNASAASGSTTSAVTVTVSSVNSAFGQAVALSCGGLPAKAVCHFTNASVTPGSSAVTSNLTISTNGASSASLSAPGMGRRAQVFAALFIPLFGIALVGAGVSPKRRRLFGLVLLGLMLTGLLILPACGGSSTPPCTNCGSNSTPPGTYHITVSGTGGGTNHSAPFTLTVN